MSGIKRKVNNFCKRNVTAEVIRLVVLCVLIVVLGWRRFISKEELISDIVDVSIILSFLFVAISEALVRLVLYIVGKTTEDDTKLTSDYKKLVEKYECNSSDMVSFGKDSKYPVIELCCRKIDEPVYSIEIVLAQEKKYKLPGQIASHSSELFDAHKYSTVYNNTNIRLNDFRFVKSKNLINLEYSFTTYFDSLITNRAMDYPFNGKCTIREIYEPGPFISELKDSKLSNHLGFNGFVELSDGKMIFVHRGNKVSIGKGTWATSIGASMKALHCLNKNKELTKQGISDAIRIEIKDELKIELPEDKDYSNTIFAFYRDLVEGGKPQFLFYLKTDLYSSETFEQHFKKKNNESDEKKNNKEKVTVDGYHFKFFTIDELRDASFSMEGICLPNNRILHMMPSSAASVALLLKSFENT